MALTLEGLIRLLLAFALPCDLPRIAKAADEGADKCSDMPHCGRAGACGSNCCRGRVQELQGPAGLWRPCVGHDGDLLRPGACGRPRPLRKDQRGGLNAAALCCCLRCQLGLCWYSEHPSLLQHAACGLVGLVLALLLESVLVIIRTTHPPSLEKYRHLQDGFQAPAAPTIQQRQPPRDPQKKRQ